MSSTVIPYTDDGYGTEVRYYLYAGSNDNRNQVTKEEWVRAERGAGFHGGKEGEPSTGGFGSGSFGGSIDHCLCDNEFAKKREHNCPMEDHPNKFPEKE